MEPIIRIVLALSLTHWFLRAILFRIPKEELSSSGRRADGWGKAILVFLAFILIILLLLNDQDISKKWLWMAFLFFGQGFQTFIDWKYQKPSKEYLISLIVLVLGEALIFFIL
ncbi:DUF4181 domain-containing protein [Paenibacillus sp. D51F]